MIKTERFSACGASQIEAARCELFRWFQFEEEEKGAEFAENNIINEIY